MSSFKLRKLFPYRNLYRLLSTVAPFHRNMVRYFQNSFEDYKENVEVNINKDEIITIINEYIRTITKRLLPSKSNVDGGLYVGVTGVAYMFYYLSKNSLLSENKRLYLEKGLEYLRPALETSAGDKTSFLLGDAGTYALAAVLRKQMDIPQYAESLKLYKSLYPAYLHPKFLKCGGDELFVGRAGYLAGVLWLSRELQTPIFTNEELYKLCDLMIDNGRKFSSKKNSPCPLMYHYYDTQYLGAAHGVSFIMQILLSVPGYTEFNKSANEDIKATVLYIASLQDKEGNWPCCTEEVGLGDHKLVHWCHGAPGIVYLMAKAYLVYKDKSFFKACINAGEIVWQKGLLRKGPGICHGVAGNGYVFLLLYRLTGDCKYLYRAKMFCDFMQSEEFLSDSSVPDNPESLYEGTAGTVCYLADLLVPDVAEFPFQDVFSTYN